MLEKSMRFLHLTIVLVFAFALATAMPLPAAAVETLAPAPASLLLTSPLVTSSYFPLLPYGAEKETPPQYLPVASNHPLKRQTGGMTRAIIVIHDQTRDATAALNMIRTLAGSANEYTLILAPQFLLEADILRFSSQLPDHGTMFARWTLSGTSSPWEDGGNSVAHPPQKGISSFTAVDLLMLYLASSDSFPDLQQIILVGHGAGANFVERYAAVGQAHDVLLKKNLSVSYVVANPSSFLYLTPQRPIRNRSGFAVPEPAACPDYDAYGYGLKNLNDYAQHVGSYAIKMRLITRHVIYLMGTDVPGGDTTPDSSCAAALEGDNRLSRAEHYGQYLDMLFGDTAHKTHNFVRLPKMGLDAVSLLGSRCGMSVLFGDGLCQ